MIFDIQFFRRKNIIISTITFFLHILTFCYTGVMFYILKGGQVYPAPPCFAVVDYSCALYGHV